MFQPRLQASRSCTDRRHRMKEGELAERVADALEELRKIGITDDASHTATTDLVDS